MFPVEIVKMLKFRTLKLDSGNYTDEQLKESFSDLVYTCKYGKRGYLKIALLFEHKSSTDKHIYFQLLRYMLNIYETCNKQQQEPMVVIPMVFYHGTQKWKHFTFDSMFGNIDETLKKYLPIFEYILVDTHDFTNKTINQLFDLQTLKGSVMLMKNIFDKERFWKNFEEIIRFLPDILRTQTGQKIFESFIIYITNNLNINKMEVIDKVQKISPEFFRNILLKEDETFIRGREEGIKMESRRNMIQVALKSLKHGQSIEYILDLTELPLTIVQNIREIYNQNNQITIEELDKLLPVWTNTVTQNLIN